MIKKRSCEGDSWNSRYDRQCTKVGSACNNIKNTFAPVGTSRESSPGKKRTATPSIFRNFFYNCYWYFTRTGLPIFSTGGIKRRPLTELFEPSVYTPRSRYVRDPWWWEYPHLKPYTPISSSYRPPAKSYLRNSYLSPIKSTYLWGHHPIRPFSEYKMI